MKVLLFVSSLLSAFVAISAQCDACLGGSCYSRKTVWPSSPGIYGQIAIDRTGNILYFFFDNLQSQYFSGAYSLNEMKLSLLSEDDSFARAVDQATRDVYRTGARGLYKYNPVKNSTSHIGLFEDTIIYNLQFHQKLYCTKIGVKGLFTFENGELKQIPALSNYRINEFVIDKHNDIYFEDDNMFRLKNGAKSPSLFGDYLHILATDKNGNVYFYQLDTNLLYKLDYSNDEIIGFGDFYTQENMPSDILFDSNNNVIYVDSINNTIYHFTPNDGVCTVSTESIVLVQSVA